jgi:DnaJ-class molecular chaperone
MSEPKVLPHRCKTCGGTGKVTDKIPGSDETITVSCSDCIDGTDGFVVFNT